MNYRTTYTRGKNMGFSVSDVRQHTPAQGNGHAEVTLDTPFTYQGWPVKGHAVVDLVQVKGDAFRPYRDVEFFVNGRNVEDMAQEATGSREYMLQGPGMNMSRTDAAAMAGMFASASTEYPHVFTYEEYVEARTPVNARLQLDPPNEQDYENYLDHMEKQLMSKDIEFVGAVTTPKQLLSRYQGLPSFEEGMAAYQQDLDGLSK